MILTFGEVMLRLAPEGFLRFNQALPGRLEATFGGGEANVAASLALMGRRVRYLTALPDHAIADCLISDLRSHGIDTESIVRAERGRVGIYFLETGANQRGSKVVYDREHSSVSLLGPDEYELDAALEGVRWLHITGITPSLSRNAFETTRRIAAMANTAGATVSCDLNFRKKLWRWEPGTEPRALARRCMPDILEQAHVLIGNEEDAEDVLNIRAEGTSVEEGIIHAAAYEDVAGRVARRFSGARQVAVTLRESLSASHNNWGGMLFDVASKRAHFAPLDRSGAYRPYEIRDIVDRVGGGDSFAAGLIYALTDETLCAPDAAIRFAVAASCLKHSIRGDINRVTAAEVRALMEGSGSGRVQR